MFPIGNIFSNQFLAHKKKKSEDFFAPIPVKTVSDGVKHQSLRSELEPIQSKKERKDSGQKMKEIVYRGVEKKRKILRKKKKQQ